MLGRERDRQLRVWPAAQPAARYRCTYIMDLDDDLRAYLESSGVLLTQLSCSCGDEHLATIAEAIDDWEPLAPHLGVLKPQQTAIKRDYPGQTVKQKQELLWQWKTQCGIEATYMNLCKVFGD